VLTRTADVRSRPPASPPGAGGLTVSVVVPTVNRTRLLHLCLLALARQERRPAQVIVVAREDDEPTLGYLARGAPADLPLSIVRVSVPGMVAALNAGLAAATGDIVAFTDDDAAPRPDWIERLVRHYEADAGVAGVGGRDWIEAEAAVPPQRNVGLVQWFGRMIGNHHLGVGPARDVDVLKGVNMSFRRVALGELRFDTRLRGTGAQIHNEVGFCLWLRRRGWRLIYDPAVAVDHAVGPRPSHDQRHSVDAGAVRDSVHNETLALLDHLPPARRAVFLLWALLVGTRAAPGAVQCVRFLVQRQPAPFLRLRASYAGRLDAVRSWWASARAAGQPASVQLEPGRLPRA
jgi:GT2 family glycosyltransferase